MPFCNDRSTIGLRLEDDDAKLEYEDGLSMLHDSSRYILGLSYHAYIHSPSHTSRIIPGLG